MSYQRTDNIKCSFCGRSSKEVESIIAGPGAYICNHCVLSSVDILKTNSAAFPARKGKPRRALTPSRIVAMSFCEPRS